MSYPETVGQFKAVVGEVEESVGYRKPLLYAIGRRVRTGNGIIASVRYPVVNGLDQNLGMFAVLLKVLSLLSSPLQGVKCVDLALEQVLEVLKYCEVFQHDGQRHLNIEVLEKIVASGSAKDIIAVFIFDDVAPEGVEDSTLKLYGLSCCHFKPNELDLTKIFARLPNVAWDGDIPIDVEEIDEELMSVAFGGFPFAPNIVDKFPLYVHRINAVKMGVRIVDANSVRLGAHLGEGTTVMGGAYINFNAGTEGPSMVEGLIASSVMVGAGSDIGNGARTIGVLSGGNNVPISIGRNCLLELNSVLGIPIGDACIVAAGVAVTAGSLVRINLPSNRFNSQTVKAREIIGLNAVTFRRNDSSGLLEVVRTGRNVEFARKLADGGDILNADLHQNT